MKKNTVSGLIVSILLVSIILIFTMSVKTHKTNIFYNREEEAYTSKYSEISIRVWEQYDFPDDRFKRAEDFLFEVDVYIDSISKFIKSNNWEDYYQNSNYDKINFFYSDKSRSYAVTKGFCGKSVYLNSTTEKNRAPIAHELTHVLAPKFSSLSLFEGLAQYIQCEYGENPSAFNYDAPVHSLAKDYINSENVLKNIGILGNPKGIDINGKDINGFYILSYSFTKYLIDNYGINKFMQIYEAEELDVMYITSYKKSLSELKKDWILFLGKQSPYEWTVDEWLDMNTN